MVCCCPLMAELRSLSDYVAKSLSGKKGAVSLMKQRFSSVTRVLALASAVVVLASCTNDQEQTADGAFTFTAPAEGDQNTSGLPDSEIAAIVLLGQTNAGPPPEGEHSHHSMGHTPGALTAADQTLLDAEVDVAQSAMSQLDTIEKAKAAGYVLATAPSPGIGTHWVRWSQIRQPFAPDKPSMILFDPEQSPPKLVGYSYAVQSPDRPVGFTGDADEWHRHTGLCVMLNGWVVGERIPGPNKCEGSFIAGGDFWMLHAWLVPGWENRDGMFAPMNPKLCPGDTGPDFLRCPDTSAL